MREAEPSTPAQNILSHGYFRVLGLSYTEGIRKDSPTYSPSGNFLRAGGLGLAVRSTCKTAATLPRFTIDASVKPAGSGSPNTESRT